VHTAQCATNLCSKKRRQLLPIIMLHGQAIRQTLLNGHFPRPLRRPQGTPSTDPMYPSAAICLSYVSLHDPLFLPHQQPQHSTAYKQGGICGVWHSISHNYHKSTTKIANSCYISRYVMAATDGQTHRLLILLRRLPVAVRVTC